MPPPRPGGLPAAEQGPDHPAGRREVETGSGTPGEDQPRQWVSVALLVLALALLTRVAGWWGLVVVGGLVLMIFLHELGHFVMAKRAGMKVTEFFLGFGPRLWSFRRGETEYGLKLIPAGAYVKIVGMNNLDEVEPADEARAYRQGRFRDRFGVAVAGSAMHFVQALVLIFILLTAVGVQGGTLFGNPHHIDHWTVGSVSSDSAAARAGLHEGDKVLSVAGKPAADFEQLRTTVANRPGDKVDVVFEHDGARQRATVRLGHQPDDPSVGLLGITPHVKAQRVGVLAAVPQTFRDFGTVSVQSVEGLGRFFSPSGISDFYHQLTNTEQKSGPTVESGSSAHHRSGDASSGGSSSNASDNRVLSIYGVFQITTSAAETAGIAAVLSLFVLINVFIGIFNLIPLLPFDGGHVVVAMYEKFQEKRQHKRRYFADVSRLLPVTYAVILVLAGLFVSTLYLDIVHPVVVK